MFKRFKIAKKLFFFTLRYLSFMYFLIFSNHSMNCILARDALKIHKKNSKSHFFLVNPISF